MACEAIATTRCLYLTYHSSRQEILTRHKNLVTAYLATNFELFFGRFNNILVQSDSYVTKRQSIKLLGEILLDRANYNVMMAYVDSGENLKLCMKLLRDDRKMVQYEGFHVFKVCRPCQLRERRSLTVGIGICGQPEQIGGCATDSHQQPGPIAEILAQIPGRPNG